MDTISSRVRLFERLLRSGFHSFLTMDGGVSIAIVKGYILRLDAGSDTLYPVFAITRGSRPLNICKGNNGLLVWGEYFNNPQKDEVYIYCSHDYGKTWEVIYVFPQGSIRHIHGIYFDVYRAGYWVLTGDHGNECRICFTKDFKSVDTIVSGSQKCRAVSCIPFPEGLVLPMDSPEEKNYIHWLDTKTGKMDEMCSIPGSAFFTWQVGGVYLVSTAAEPSKVNQQDSCFLLYSLDGKQWNEFYKQKKDAWHFKYFQFGALSFPMGSSRGNYIYAGGQALKNDDGMLLRWDVDRVMSMSSI